MDTSLKKTLLSGLAASVPMFLLGAVGHGVLLRGYREGTPLDRPMLPVLYLSVLVLATLMAFVYARVRPSGSAIRDGLFLGILFAITWTVPGGLSRFGALQGVELGKIFADAAWHLIEEGVGGVVLVLVATRLRSSAPAPGGATSSPA
jgi:hypothetical protein